MDKKFLVADDSAFMRKMLVEILKEGGFTNVVEAENGKIALEKIEAEKPDLTLLDIIMPEVDGVEVTKQASSKTKIIIISAIGQDGIIKEAKDNGALGFIVKPFQKDQVLEEVKKHL